MKITDIFRPLKSKMISRYKELGVYQSTFSVFGDDIYQSAIVRASIRPLADFSSKAIAKCGDKRIEKMLNTRPNMYMSGHDFLLKIRTKLELLNVAFIYLQRDDKGKAIGAYPVPYTFFEAVEYSNGLFIKFYFSNPDTPEMILPWDDLCVLRKDYNSSDIAGDNNQAIVSTLQTMQTMDEGLANSIKATANIRGLLKLNVGMLSDEDIKKQKDAFVADYLNLDNKAGVAAIDKSKDFVPIDLKPQTANAGQRKDIREDIYRYFGVNDDIIMANIKTEALENFYRLRIEPFLIQLSQELTAKIFAGKARAYEGNVITYMTEQGQFMTISQKIDLFNKVVLYNGMLVDEWRALLGLGHIEGGDKPIMRLDAAHVLPNGQQMGRDEDNNQNDDSDDSEESEDES